MTDTVDLATLVNQRIDKDVRQLIGDMHMQLITLRAMVELIQQQQPPPQPEPAPKPQPRPVPEPIPPQPEQVPEPKPHAAKTNGSAPFLRG